MLKATRQLGDPSGVGVGWLALKVGQKMHVISVSWPGQQPAHTRVSDIRTCRGPRGHANDRSQPEDVDVRDRDSSLLVDLQLCTQITGGFVHRPKGQHAPGSSVVAHLHLGQRMRPDRFGLRDERGGVLPHPMHDARPIPGDKRLKFGLYPGSKNLGHYFWFRRFVFLWQQRNEPDAGLEQQAFGKLAETSADIDWTVIEELDRLARATDEPTVSM